MQSITHALNIPFDEVFEDVFGMFKVTGDSGRSSDVIGDRERQVPSDIMEGDNPLLVTNGRSGVGSGRQAKRVLTSTLGIEASAIPVRPAPPSGRRPVVVEGSTVARQHQAHRRGR